eukprot:gene12163-13418_t
MSFLVNIGSTAALSIILAFLVLFWRNFHYCNKEQVRKVCAAAAYANANFPFFAIYGTFCKILCAENAVITKCLSVNKDKTVFELNVGQDDVYILKFLNSDSSSSSHELYIFETFNGSELTVPFYGKCGPIYAVQSASHLAGQVYGNADDIDDILNLPDLFDFESTRPGPVENFIIDKGRLNNFFSYVVVTARNMLYDTFVRVSYPTFREKVHFMRQVFLMLDKCASFQLLICDFHLNNFGFTRDDSKTVKIIDADHVFPADMIKKKFSTMPCVSDKDCKIGDSNDCIGYCNVDTRMCKPIVLFSNLRNVANILLSIIIAHLSHEEYSQVSAVANKLSGYSETHYSSAQIELLMIRDVIKTFDDLIKHLSYVQ